MYIDCRKLISFPQERSEVTRLFAKIVEEQLREEEIQVIAGGETAGIPYAAFLADRLRLPMIYVRKQPKSFGRLQQIEGYLKEGARVLLVEDLNFDAKSKISFCEGIERAGGVVSNMLVVFDYGNSKTQDNLKSHNLRLHALTNGRDVAELAAQRGYFNRQEFEEVNAFLSNPEGWHSTK